MYSLTYSPRSLKLKKKQHNILVDVLWDERLGIKISDYSVNEAAEPQRGTAGE